MLPELRTKRAAEVRTISVDLSDMLDEGETLTGSPTITSTPSGLTIDNEQISDSALTINDREVSAGLVVQFTASGGTARQTYSIILQSDTSGSQTIEVELRLRVV